MRETCGTGRGEFAAIDRIRRLLSGRSPAPVPGEVWIGDDAAVLEDLGGPYLFSTDISVAGVHADLDLIGLDDLGWRAVVAAVSDIAAMGGDPAHAVVSVAGPPPTDLELLYEGIAAAAEAHRCPVVGGDLSAAGELVVSVAVTGRVGDGPPPVLRSGASPGDTLLVTGPLGASAAGLRVLRDRRRRRVDEGVSRDVWASAEEESLIAAHRHPRALIEEGRTSRTAGASAMIDVSDGLAADLGHLCEASRVGFDLHDLPVASGASEQEALGGGEDYELVIAAPDPSRILTAFEAAGLGPPMTIGVCTHDSNRRTLHGRVVATAGYEHAWELPGSQGQ